MGDEIYIQIPEASDAGQQIAASTQLTYNFDVDGDGGKVMSLSVDLPTGVQSTIALDNKTYWFYSKGNEKGTLRFNCGIKYQKLNVKIKNTNVTAQDCHVRLIIQVL